VLLRYSIKLSQKVFQGFETESIGYCSGTLTTRLGQRPYHTRFNASNALKKICLRKRTWWLEQVLWFRWQPAQETPGHQWRENASGSNHHLMQGAGGEIGNQWKRAALHPPALRQHLGRHPLPSLSYFLSLTR
jgi:hypothetical protein